MLSVHELRERAIVSLAERSANYQTDPATIDRARHIMNCFYRLAGMDGRLLILENDERTYNRRSTKELAERAERSRKKLHTLLEEFDADICYCGAYPSFIERTRSEGGGVTTLNLEYWYQ